MANLVIKSLFFVSVITASLAQYTDWDTTRNPNWDYTTYIPESTPHFLDCTINGQNVLEIPIGDPFVINQTIYDNIPSAVMVPSGGNFSLGRGVTYIAVEQNSYVSIDAYTITGSSPYVKFRVQPVKEAIEVSQPGDKFYYNFTILLRCDGIDYRIGTVIPLHETNTYTPAFSKNIYEYSLFSPYSQDLDRLLELNPITAIDNDISSTELKFSIEPNAYFELQYDDVVPGTLNKKHFARLVPKNTSIVLSKTLDLTMQVTDLGYPPKSSNATLIIQSLSSKPTFKKAYYIGDYYLNNTFQMRSQPELERVSDHFRVTTTLKPDTWSTYTYFGSEVLKNGTVEITNWENLPELDKYKNPYLLYTLTAIYTDPSLNDFESSGTATVIIEMHTF